jgi:hypothetical protein
MMYNNSVRTSQETHYVSTKKPKQLMLFRKTIAVDGENHTVIHMTPARQRLGKHGLKAGIAAEAEVNLLGNGTQIPVSAATNINKGILVSTKRRTKDN